MKQMTNSHQFPEAFKQRVENDPFLGIPLLEALNQTAPVSVRLHPLKQKAALTFTEKIAWCEHAFYLKERPSFTLDPLFHAGCYYPQEAGSMVLDTVLKQLDLPSEPSILDLCAAPGGKSTLIASFLNNNGLLVSNEVIQARARILTENTTKWGYTNTVVTNNDPKDFERLNEFFDVIVVDAPCSGEGMFRKDIKARDEWSEENVQICSSRQKRIVMDVWDSLKPGGFLIYSTCTFNSAENEDTIAWYLNELEARYVQLEMPEELVAGRNDIGHYCLPGKTVSEGFYIAVLQKEATTPARQRFTRKPLFKVQKDLLDAENYVKVDEALLLNWNDKLLLVPNQLEEKMLHVQAQMRIQKMGLMLGEIAKKGIIPSVELALNPTRLNRISTIELTEKEALMYLHGDTFPLQGPQGFQIVSYKNEPLGWIKNIGNRFNNLFPKEWRIRMNIQ